MGKVDISFKGSNSFSKAIGIKSGKITIKFGDGIHNSGYSYKQLAKMLTNGFEIETTSGKIYDVPARPLFSKFTAEYKEDIIKIIKSSFRLRFKGVKANTQFLIAGEEIKDFLIGLVKTGGLGITPDNSEYTKSIKGDWMPPWVDTGELIESLEANYRSNK